MAMSTFEKRLDDEKIKQFIKSDQQAVVIDKERHLLLVRANLGTAQQQFFLCRCDRTEDRVGVGAFSEVYPAQAIQYNPKDGAIRLSQADDFVIKIFKNNLEDTKKKTSEYADFSLAARQREATNFRKMYGVCSDVVSVKSDKAQGISFMVQKKLPGMPLSEVDSLSPQETNRLGLQIAQELSIVHAKGMVHLDLKLANTLLSPREDEFSAKLCDFGRSVQLPKNHMHHLMTAHGIPIADLDKERYPKECFEGRAGFATDVFMLGKLLQRDVVLRNDNFPTLSKTDESGEKIKQMYQQFLNQMTNPEASERPNLDEVQNFFLKMDFLFRLEATAPHDYDTKTALYQKMCQALPIAVTERQKPVSTYDLLATKLGGFDQQQPEERKTATLVTPMAVTMKKSPSKQESSEMIAEGVNVHILKDLILKKGNQEFNKKCKEIGEISKSDYDTLNSYLEGKIQTAGTNKNEILRYETMQELLTLHCAPQPQSPRAK